MMGIKPRFLATTMLGLIFPLSALATNGYFISGASMQQMAMAGTGTAMVGGAGVAALNPAGEAFVGTEFDFSFSLFEPQRSFQAYPIVDPNAQEVGILTLGPSNGAVRSSNRHFYIPGMAFNWRLNDDTSIGVIMYGNGGLDTKYNGQQATFATNFLAALGPAAGALVGILPPGVQTVQSTCDGTFGGKGVAAGSSDILGFCGHEHHPAGVDLIQLFIGPYFARKITPTFSIGIEPLIAVQRFKANGLGAFAPFSNNPQELTGRGYSYSYGGGVRLGFLWAVLPTVGIGGSYQSHVFMTHFKKYAGLFADKGKFDIPSNFNVGIQFHPWPNHRFLFDFQRIYYSEIASVGNPFNAAAFVNNCAVPRLMNKLGLGGSGPGTPLPSCLGADKGPGFNWHDMSIFKFGYQFQYHDLKLRLGYSFAESPIKSNSVLFNILATGVIQRHLTGGFSYRLTHALSVDMAFVYAFGHSVSGRNPLSNLHADGPLHFTASNNADGYQTVRLYMRQFRAALGFEYRF